jgi:hypothetical protein
MRLHGVPAQDISSELGKGCSLHSKAAKPTTADRCINPGQLWTTEMNSVPTVKAVGAMVLKSQDVGEKATAKPANDGIFSLNDQRA